MNSRKILLSVVLIIIVGIFAAIGLLRFDPPEADSVQQSHHETATAAVATSAATADDTNNTGWPRSVTDSRGATTVLQQQPQRIVSLAPSATQILRAIGADAELIAIPREGSDQAESGDLLRIGVYPAPSGEAVLSLRPDLVLGADITSPASERRLRELGLPLITLAGSTYEAILQDITSAGAATGREAIAAIVCDALAQTRQRVDAEVQAATASAPRPQVLLFIGESLEYAAGPGSYSGDLLQIAGADNAAAKLRQPWPLLSREFILETNPQALIFCVPPEQLSHAASGQTAIAGGRADALSHALAADPIWKNLQAVRNNQVYAIDHNLLNLPGPHVGEALLQLRAIVRDTAASSKGN